MSLCPLLADVVATVHAAFVAFVVAGLVLIVGGATAGWDWVRNFYFRAGHLLAIVLVCSESIVGWTCPLTTIESRLRVSAGGEGYAQGFLGYWIDRLIFYDLPPRVFMLAYIAFAAVVAIVFILVPPRLGDDAIARLFLRRGVR
jgi:hypothetical protein